MHEMSVTRSIVDACSERANGARIIRVSLEIGTLCCIMPAALQFCYEVAVEGTDLEGSELEIIRVPGWSRCRDCGADVRMNDLLCSAIAARPISKRRAAAMSSKSSRWKSRRLPDVHDLWLFRRGPREDYRSGHGPEPVSGVVGTRTWAP